MKRLFSIISILLFTWVIGGTVSAFCGINPTWGILAVGTAQVVSGFVSWHIMPAGIAMSGTDLSAIARYAHQFQKKLIMTLVNGLDAVNDIMLLPGIKTSMKLPKLTVGDGFRPYSATTQFYTGNAVYTDRELKVDVGKRELLIDPEDFRPTYLSLMLSPGSGANKIDIPFANYLWDGLINSVKREINDEVVYFGFDKTDATAYSEASTYSAGDIVTFTGTSGILEYFLCIDAGTTTAGEDPDDTPTSWQKVTARAVVPGLKSYIDAAITATTLTETATGVIDNTTGQFAYAAFLELFRVVSIPYRRAGVIIHCSYTDFDFLTDDLVTNLKYTIGDITEIMQNGMLPLPGTERKCWVKPATWLTGSRRLIAEPLDLARAKGVNLVMGTDLLSDVNEIKTVENLWTLEAGIKMVLGFQISDLDALWIGDQD